jgi:hemolysin activation/secretion protein
MPYTLVGTGLGLLWQMGDNFSARFDWGIPLVPIPPAVERNSWNANGFYFTINWNLF